MTNTTQNLTTLIQQVDDGLAQLDLRHTALIAGAARMPADELESKLMTIDGSRQKLLSRRQVLTRALDTAEEVAEAQDKPRLTQVEMSIRDIRAQLEEIGVDLAEQEAVLAGRETDATTRAHQEARARFKELDLHRWRLECLLRSRIEEHAKELA